MRRRFRANELPASVSHSVWRLVARSRIIVVLLAVAATVELPFEASREGGQSMIESEREEQQERELERERERDAERSRVLALVQERVQLQVSPHCIAE
jgi:Tfp pilus assembly protein PilO